MLNQEHFYHGSFKKAISIFGTLFNDIYVITKDSEGREIKSLKVPLAYGPKKKFLARIDDEPDLEGQGIAIKLPRLSFEITGVSYDTNAKINKYQDLRYSTAVDTSRRKKLYTYAPYIVNLQLSAIVKNSDDGLQIVEQIIPYFQPDYNVTYKPVNDVEVDIKDDVPITLSGVSIDEDYSGDFLTRRAIIYNLDFTMKIRFYGPVKEQGIIREIYPTFFLDDNNDPKVELKHSTDPADAAKSDNWTFTTEIL